MAEALVGLEIAGTSSMDDGQISHLRRVMLIEASSAVGAKMV